MAHFNAQHPPPFQPLPFNDFGQIVEWNIPAAPILGPVPLPEFDEGGEAFQQWLPYQFGQHLNAEKRYGLLTPPKTPLPLFLEQQPYETMPVLEIFDDVQGDPLVLDIQYINEGMEEGLDNEFNLGPAPIPMLIDDDYAQETGLDGFDVVAMSQEFEAIFSEDEESETVKDEEGFYPDLMMGEAPLEHEEWYEDDEEEVEEMDWDGSEAQNVQAESRYSSGGKK